MRLSSSKQQASHQVITLFGKALGLLPYQVH
jgi:hypothetical protein